MFGFGIELKLKFENSKIKFLLILKFNFCILIKFILINHSFYFLMSFI